MSNFKHLFFLLFFSFISNLSISQLVSVPFKDGFIGSIGSNTQQADILSLATYSVEAIITNASGYTLTDGTSNELIILPPPTITTSGALKTFASCSGCTVTPQSFTVAGADLTNDIVVTAPTGFQVSDNAGASFASSITLTQTSGTLTTTTVYVKLANNATTASSGNITIASTGASSHTITATANTDNALNFDGSNDYVSIPDNAALDFTNAFTIEGWIYPSSNSGVVFGKIQDVSSGDGDDIAYALRLSASGFRAEVSNGTKPSQFITANNLTLNKWQHVAMVYSNGILSLFVNGVLSATGNTGYGTGSLKNSSSSFKLGVYSTNFGQYFTGSIDHLKLWNTAKSQSELAAGLNTELNGNETGLVAYYNFNHGIAGGTNSSITTIDDRTSNAFTGTLNGFAKTGATSNFISGTIPEITATGNATTLASGSTLQLANPLAGGTWSSTNTSFATVDASTGLVTGVAAGAVTINYTICNKVVNYTLSILTPTPTPTITTTGTLTAFTTCAGSASATQTFTVSGANLTNNITLTAPTGYEMSTTVGGVYSSTISLTQVSGVVSATQIFVRLTANAINAAAGNITATSTGATSQTIATGTGTVTSNPIAPVVQTQTNYCEQPQVSEYKFAKVVFTDVKDMATAQMIQVAEWKWFNGSSEITRTGTVVTNPGGNSPSNESPEYIYDGNANTKWLDFSIASNTHTSTLLFTFPGQGFQITGYSWVTANDYLERDPKSWTVYMSNDGTNWTEVHTVTGYVAPTGRFVTTSNWDYATAPNPITLSATALTNHTLRWYANATGGTILTSTPLVSTITPGIFTSYVSQVNQDGCESPRATLAININQLPATPTAVNGSRNGAGTVPISVTVGTGETAQWYASLTGGTILTGGTGTLTFTTASISATTTYYAEARNATTGCISTTRTGVIATVSTLPVITTTGTLNTFTTCASTASAAQTFTITGINLTNNITLTAPTGYEMSTTIDGVYSSTISITQVSGVVSATQIFVRLTATAINATAGNITATSTDATTQTVATGAATVNALPATPIITSSQFNATVCEGAPVILTATAVTDATNYLWNDPATSSTAAITVSPIANTTYSVTATNANGCASTASITVRIANPAGNFGNAINFDGINDAVLLGANSPAFQNTITIETWVKALNNTNDKNILSWGYALDGVFNWNDNVQLRLSGHKLEWGMHSYSNNVGWQSVTSNKNIDDGVWHHIAIVKDGNTSRMYIDGKLEATQTMTHTMTVNRFVIGAAFGGSTNSQFFNGSLDELRIWNAALTLDEIRSRMNRELIGNETNLTALYNFNEGVAGANNTSITTINNSTTNAHNGTIANIAMNGTSSNFVVGPSFVLPEITGNTIIASAGDTAQLSNAIYGGIWSITTNTFATINSTGLLTSTNIGQGTATVTYTLSSSLSCGSLQKSILVTVDPAAIITGPSGNAGDATSTKSINENTTPVFTFTANETVSWSIDGGSDVAKFSINSSTGALSFITEPDYEIPTDANTNNTYIVIIKAVDAVGNISKQTVTVTVLDVDDTAPSITGPSGNAGDATSTKSINENTTPVFTFTANETVSWSIDGGLDAAKFTLNSSTGALSFITEPDYEIPTDANTNNTYIVIIKAVDAVGNISKQTVTVTVLDVYDNVPPPPTLIGGVYLYGSVIPSLPSFIKSLPPNTIPVWCNTTTNICSETHPATPIEVGRYIYQVRSYDTLSKKYSVGFANDTIIVKPLVPQVRNATYIIGLLTNPTNIAVQVTGVQGSTINYFLNATKQSSTPTLGNTVSVKRYTVSQTVNTIESDTAGFNVTMLNQNDMIHLQKIAETPVLQSNSTFNITYKFIVNNLTAQELTNVLVADNLQNTIPITSEYSILNIRATGGLFANASFNGSSDIYMSTSTSKVAAYAKDTLVFTLNIKPKGFSGVMNNTATIAATTPYGVIAMVSSAVTKDAETTKSPTPITLPDVIIDIPEVFTPNRDGVNDKFVILKPFGTTLNLEIFNRWGNIVYLNTNYNSEWDGRGTNNFIGQDLLDGGYYYNLKATNSNGETKIFKGFVIIQR